MKNFGKVLFSVLLIAVMAIGVIACGDGSQEDQTPVITGVTQDAVYYLDEGEIKPSYDVGEGMLAKDGGEGEAFASGTAITETGAYVLTVTNGEKSVTVSFTVEDSQKPFPVVSGVTDEEIYYVDAEGYLSGDPDNGKVAPVFDAGIATLAKDGEAAEAFESGTEISAWGSYVLTVTNGPRITTVSFTLAEYFPVYPGQITDLFDNTKLSTDYEADSTAEVSVSGGVLRIKNTDVGDPWSIVRKTFVGVNATENPFIEVNVAKVSNGENVRIEIKLCGKDSEGNQLSATEELCLSANYAGKYYIDLLGWVQKKELNATDQDIVVSFAVVGEKAGYAEAEIDYIKSVAEIPASEPAAKYVDNTTESLSLWRNDTATIEAEDDQGVVYVTNSKESEEYGQIIKRVELNTKAYPYLVVDIGSVTGAQWSLKCIYNGSEITLQADTGAVGKTEIDLVAKGLPESENVIVTFKFMVIGKGIDKMVVLNGFETNAESAKAPSLNIDFSTADGWAACEGGFATLGLTAEGGKGIFKLAGSGYAAMEYSALLNTKEYRYLVIDVESADCAHVIKIGGHAIYTEAKTTGKIYVDMQADGSAFEEGFSVNVTWEFYLIGDAENTVVVNGIYTTNEAPDKDLIDDFSKSDWSVPDAEAGSVTIGSKTLTLVKAAANGDWAKTNKTITVDTSAKHIIKFGIKEMSGAVFDAGFKIDIINQGLAGWPTVSVTGDKMTKIEREGGGYDVYIDLEELATAAGKDVTAFVGKDISLFFELCVGLGDTEKSVTFDGITLVAEVPSAE